MSALNAPAYDPTYAARRFVRARLNAVGLPGYPGSEPTGPGEAYACQEAAMELWPDVVAGWKVGRLPAEAIGDYGGDRLAGPIFQRNVWPSRPDAATTFPIIAGGFAAVEAEFVFKLREDAPADKFDWTREEAAALTWDVRLGVEIAGSPLEAINDLGPAVTISDFGNNAGLILGPELPGGAAALDGLDCETRINGARVGFGRAGNLPGGPLESLRFLLSHVARRGRPLKAGQLVSSGAVTGVHRVQAGAEVEVRFGPDEVLQAQGVRAAPEAVRSAPEQRDS